MCNTAATSFSGTPIRRTDASPFRRTDASQFQTIKELAEGALRALIREAGLTVGDFMALL